MTKQTIDLTPYIVAYTIWLVTGMLAGLYVISRIDHKTRWMIGFRDVWSRVPTSGPLVLLLLLDMRNARKAYDEEMSKK